MQLMIFVFYDKRGSSPIRTTVVFILESYEVVVERTRYDICSAKTTQQDIWRFVLCCMAICLDTKPSVQAASTPMLR